MTKENKIYQTLQDLSIIEKKSVKVFSNKTRDNNNLKVYKCHKSKTIFIKDFVTSEKIYKYYKYKSNDSIESKIEIEDIDNVKRRVNKFKSYIFEKKILDFGCSDGLFLKAAKKYTNAVCGVELNKECIKYLNREGIDVTDNLNDFPDESFDTIFAFHVLEHLDEPLKFLTLIRKKLKKDGNILIEVPHSNDILLSTLSLSSFKDFTLWSQHLILYNEFSLKKTLAHSKFKAISIKGCQRYGISNHLFWLILGKPGGHKTLLKFLDHIFFFYKYFLIFVKKTDTIYAIAQK